MRASKSDDLLCVVLSVSFEFVEQLPCNNHSSPGCEWSFFRYVPANCNNYHGTICQHKDKDSRDAKWPPSNKNDLTELLQKTALTSEFGYTGNKNVIRSKYKQTFGLFYCPQGYRIYRADRNPFTAWSLKPTSKTELYEYDYSETYWVVDKNMYDKAEDSKCTTVTVNSKEHKYNQVKCTEWHFYLCVRLGRRPGKNLTGALNIAPPMEWKPGPQPRVFPILDVLTEECKPYDGKPCECKAHGRGVKKCEYNSATNRCVPTWKECPKQLFTNGFCQRQGEHIYYSIGGVICNSKKTNSNCDISQTLYAANFGSASHAPSGKDSRNISFRWYGGKSEFKDPLNIWHEGMADKKGVGVPLLDNFLYIGFMWGVGDKNRPPRCVSLVLNLVGDGNYEISIKTGELGHSKIRVFSILLNDQYIVDEIEVAEYRGNVFGLDLNANFKISQSETMIEIQGYPVKGLIQKGKVKLVLCTSKCKKWVEDVNYVVNAISVVKFVGK